MSFEFDNNKPIYLQLVDIIIKWVANKKIIKIIFLFVSDFIN